MIDVKYVISLLDEAVILERERKLRKHNVSGSAIKYSRQVNFIGRVR